MKFIKSNLAVLAVATLACYCSNAQTSVSSVSSRSPGRPYIPPPDPRVIAAQIQAQAAAQATAQREAEAQRKAIRDAEQKNLEYGKQLNQQAAAQAEAQRKAVEAQRKELLDKETATLQQQRSLAIAGIEKEYAAPELKEKLSKLQNQLNTQNPKLDNTGLKQQIAVYSKILQQKQDELAKRTAAVEADYQNKLAASQEKVKNVLIQKQAEQKRAGSAKTIEWLQGKAANGEAAAQYSLGVRYLKGDGVEQDKAKARDYLKKAADQGHGEAITALKELDAASM